MAGSEDALRQLRALLLRERVLSLAVLVEGRPLGGVLPYVVTADFGAVLVHASALARHSRGLSAGAPFALTIHQADHPGADPLQLPRVSLEGVVEVLERGSDDHREAARRVLDRFPSSAPTFSLGDFGLYRLRFERGRWVGGFAGALSLSPANLARLAAIDGDGE